VSDVIIIGAGVVGLAAARFLAAEGAKALVVEGQRVGAEASSAAAGILAAQAEAGEETPLLALALAGRDHHARLAPLLKAETGIDVDHSKRGLLTIALSAARADELARQAAWHRGHGLAVEELGPEEVREAEPNLNPAVLRALYFTGDHRVDNVRLTKALAASAVSRGVSILSGRPVGSLVVEHGRVAGVRAGSETFRAPVVLNAMGAWAGLLGGDPSPPPVEPVRGQMVAFDLSPPLLRHVVYCGHGYLVPRGDGRLLAGSTMERAGFDKSVTADGLRAVLASALEIAPVLGDVRIAETWAGLRPATPDGLPVLGPGALPGLVHAGGLYRNGILMGPLVGELAAEIVLGRSPRMDVAAFSPARFRKDDPPVA
jgi:glycine oxidase